MVAMNKGDRILLDEEGNKYLVKLADEELHTDLGVVDLGEVIGKDPGDRVESHLGNEFVVLLPSPIDYFQKIKRKSQIILPKDAAQIVAHTGVGPGNHVVDAGAGSGALAIFLGNLVRPDGRVISYEIREDFAKVAKENIEMSGLGDIVEVKIGNVYEGIDERDLDLITLDLPRPDRVLPHAEVALKPGAFLTAFSTCIERVKLLYEKLPQYRFRDYRTIESLARDLEVGRKCTRPSTRMIAHTGYLSFARRV